MLRPTFSYNFSKLLATESMVSCGTIFISRASKQVYPAMPISFAVSRKTVCTFCLFVVVERFWGDEARNSRSTGFLQQFRLDRCDVGTLIMLSCRVIAEVRKVRHVFFDALAFKNTTHHQASKLKCSVS